jgi:hypothetical protein
MSKRNFYEIFHAAWLKSFIPENITGGFKKTGIFPLVPPVVLDKITRKPATLPDTQEKGAQLISTPMTSKSIRQAQKRYKANPTKANLNVILKSQERLAVQHEVNKHLQSGLLETLKTEKKRRQHGKKLNLLGETDTGAQLFHSSRVLAALAYEVEKNKKAAIEKADK